MNIKKTDKRMPFFVVADWQTRKRLFEIADYTSRMTHIYIRCALMAY
jgi:hypothetical protein